MERRDWYVFAEDKYEEEVITYVVGPFDNATDAKAYALDTFHDNGWRNVEAKYVTHEEALARSTDDKIKYPYEEA